MLGKVLNNRYKLIKELGKGGMALVFEALDLVLDRKVAIKMLRPEYVSDKLFVKKFHREARAVAKLSHVNVVSIFDIGQDNEYHYLVMEDIEGKNLKDIIKERGRIDISEALDISRQICSALIIAHKNNVIHCDIKPHNILINHDNQVKVTDFGIARAVTSSTMTMTDSIMGSVHYFSPEQASGGEVNTYSDIYSLGIVLYEMLTGEVPFKGDSPISVALKHIQDKVISPSNINSEIPVDVEKIVMKALAKEPKARFLNASEMKDAIIRALQNISSVNSLNKTSNDLSIEETKILDRNVLNKTRNSNGNKSYLTESSIDKKKKLKIWLFTSFIFLLFSVFAFYYIFQNYMDVPIIQVPDIIGMDYEEAEEFTSQVGLHLEKQNEGVYSPEVPEGKIISQFPVGGERVRQTRSILVTVSKGPAVITLPDLSGKTLREAEVLLDNLKIEIGNRVFKYNNDVPKNNIISQEPEAGEEITSYQKINIIISKGKQPNMVIVPNLLGLSREEAISIINENSLNLGEIKEEMTKRFKSNQVASQSYQAGSELAENTSIDLTVSKGLINNEGDKIHTMIVRVNIDPGPQDQKIEIYVIDNNGRDLVYTKLHHPGDKWNPLTINSVGPTTFEVYNNGQLIVKKRID
jgi:eukaryotic-like serine/threonine-protein kinase